MYTGKVKSYKTTVLTARNTDFDHQQFPFSTLRSDLAAK